MLFASAIRELKKALKFFIAKLFARLIVRIDLQKIHIVTATRFSESDFWVKSALGESLKKIDVYKKFKYSIFYENNLGLSTVYNKAITDSKNYDILVFIHDDVFIDCKDFVIKVTQGLINYDVIGVAGNTRLYSSMQPAWAFKEIKNNAFVWDWGFLSGTVWHGKNPHGDKMYYGPVPMRCELIDGVMIAAKAKLLRKKNVYFDERFKFHFYDIDFCRTSTKAGLTIGTWPIELTHQSPGGFGTQQWQDGYSLYIKKWK